MPQSRPVPAWIVGFGQIVVYILHGGLQLIESIPQFDQIRSRHQNVVGSEAVGYRQVPCFVGALTVAASAVRLRPARALRGPKRTPTPETPTNDR